METVVYIIMLHHLQPTIKRVRGKLPSPGRATVEEPLQSRRNMVIDIIKGLKLIQTKDKYGPLLRITASTENSDQALRILY